MSEETDNNFLSSNLNELRSRLIKSLLFILFVFIVSYTFAESIYNFLLEPYASAVKN